ncbi:ehhadh [Symbiodinium sp. CCMP2592]|nr:ehhadh [Symbiodinium sp. CCMP2592]
MNSPPVNSLGTSLVTSFKQEFPKLVQDPKVKAIVVTGSGSMFSGGAEITEFAMMVAMGEAEMRKNNPVAALSEMMDTIDASPKTVVAALNGPALGGGCEVSLACHYRVAAPKASVGFPEVNLGLLPGAQGTQRLPRVAALPVALPMILQGRPMNAEAAKKNGIIDAVAKGDVVDEAAEFALTHPPAPISKREVPKTNRFMMAAGGPCPVVPPETSSFVHVLCMFMDSFALAGLEGALNTAFNAQPLMVAPGGIIKCFEAACSGKSFREGVAVEMEEFTKLVFSVQSAALRHLFLAERMAQKVPGVNEKPAPLKKIGILGAGLMGGGIAMCFVQKGVPVVLKDAKQEWLDDGMKKIQGLWGGQAKRGRLSQDKYKQYMSLLKPTLDYADFKDVDMVIEAVPEIMDLKKQVFLDIEKNTKPDALICTNTSGLNIDDIAAVLKDPSRVMGTHFFSPANVMQLLENVRTSKSSTKTLATGMVPWLHVGQVEAMGKLISKKAIMVGNCDGFVGNRMLAPYAGEAKMVLEEGRTSARGKTPSSFFLLLLDELRKKFGSPAAAQRVQAERRGKKWRLLEGMAMGPMALGDLVGLELFWKQRKARPQLEDAQGSSVRFAKLLSCQAAGDMQKQTKTYYGPYELTDHPRVQFVVTRSEGHTSAKGRLVSVHVFKRSGHQKGAGFCNLIDWWCSLLTGHKTIGRGVVQVWSDKSPSVIL